MTLKRNRAVARFMSFMIVATMVIGLFASAVTQVFADAQGTYTDADGSVYSYVWTDSNADNYYESTDGLTVMDATGNPVTVPAIVNAVKQSLPQKPSSVQTTDQVIDEITDTLHTHADIGAASRSLEGLTEIVNTVIGVLAIAILTLVGIFTAIDVLYLEVPPLHNSLDNGAMDKGQTNKSGGVKPKIISEDASQAYSEAM